MEITEPEYTTGMSSAAHAMAHITKTSAAAFLAFLEKAPNTGRRNEPSVGMNTADKSIASLFMIILRVRSGLCPKIKIQNINIIRGDSDVHFTFFREDFKQIIGRAEDFFPGVAHMPTSVGARPRERSSPTADSIFSAMEQETPARSGYMS